MAARPIPMLSGLSSFKELAGIFSELRLEPLAVQPPVSFSEFIRQFYSGKGISGIPHVEHIASVLQRVADGHHARVMILMPPGHRQTTILEAFISYLEYREKDNKDRQNICYVTSDKNSALRVANAAVEIAGTHVQERSRVVGEAPVMHITAMGAFGCTTGRRFGTTIIDSLYDPQKAKDLRYESRLEDAYDMQLSSRGLTPKGPAIIFADCRWHRHDLAAYIMNRNTDQPWHVVCLPAIATSSPPVWLLHNKHYAGTTIEPDYRRGGDVLCPEIHTPGDYVRIRERIGFDEWRANYMLDPTC